MAVKKKQKVKVEQKVQKEKKETKEKKLQKNEKTGIIKKGKNAFSIILALVAIIISLFSMFKGEKKVGDVTNLGNSSYTVYISLTDKNVGHQNFNISANVIKEQVKTMCRQHYVQYVIYTTEGEYKEDSGNMHKEQFLVIDIPEASKTQLEELVKDIAEYTQSSNIKYKKTHTTVVEYKK